MKYLFRIFEANMQAHRGKMTIHRGRSSGVLPKLARCGFDFIYVDGSHKAEDVYEDAVSCFALCKVGGIIMFDDYQWEYYADSQDNPRAAIDRVPSERSGHYQLLHKTW